MTRVGAKNTKLPRAPGCVDARWAGKIEDALRAAGVKAWVDSSDIQVGVEWERAITEALRSASAVLVLSSRAARQSNWIANELLYAQAAGIQILPVMPDGEPLPQISNIQHFDLTGSAEVPPALVDAAKSVSAPERPEHGRLARLVFDSLAKGRFSRDLDELIEKAVLLLGNFEEPLKTHLIGLQGALDAQGLHPIIFDFVRPEAADFGETVCLLAGLSGFIVADLAAPRSVLMELQLIVRSLAVPVVPLIEKGTQPPALFSDLRKYDWVLPPRPYEDFSELLRHVRREVIEPAQEKRSEINRRKCNHD